MSVVAVDTWAQARADLNDMPINLEAELELIAAAVFDPRALHLARDMVGPDDFADALHGRIWAGVSALVLDDKPLIPNQLAESFKADLEAREIAPLRFFADLINHAPPAEHAPGLAGIVAGLAIRRRIIAAADEARRSAIQLPDDVKPHDLAAQTRKAMELIEQGASPGEDLFEDARHAGAARLEMLEQELACGKPKGLRSGLSAIDRRLGGLLPGSLIVVAGRPGMAKTATLGNILYGAARENPTKIFAGFSLEMGTDQLTDRALSRLTADDPDPIPYERLTKGQHAPSDLMRLHELRSWLPSNLWLRDRAGLSVEDVERAVWWLKRRGDLGAIGIDYLQIMRRPRADGRNDASVIASMTTALKTLARQAGISIVLLSQLNRSVETRDPKNKRPQLADLRESGAIEQDADAVLFPFREVYYLLKEEPEPGTDKHLDWTVEVQDKLRKMEIIVAKSRHGGEGVERQLYFAEIDLIKNDGGRF